VFVHLAGLFENVAESLGPFVLDSECERVGEQSLEQLGRRFRPLEPADVIAFRGPEVHLEAFDLVHQPSARARGLLQQLVEDEVGEHQHQQCRDHRDRGRLREDPEHDELGDHERSREAGEEGRAERAGYAFRTGLRSERRLPGIHDLHQQRVDRTRPDREPDDQHEDRHSIDSRDHLILHRVRCRDDRE